jgi:hypothetical protein
LAGRGEQFSAWSTGLPPTRYTSKSLLPEAATLILIAAGVGGIVKFYNALV